MNRQQKLQCTDAGNLRIKNKEENDKNSKRKNLQVQFGKIVSRQSK